MLHAAVSATVVLEDEPITNAGCGSNLTESGVVENDASVMRGDGLWAAVGAVQGLANPILAAHRLALDSLQPMPLGRVRPMYGLHRRCTCRGHLMISVLLYACHDMWCGHSMLTGQGAYAWAQRTGVPGTVEEAHRFKCNVTDRAQRQWTRYSKMLQEGAPCVDCQRFSPYVAGA